MTDIEKHVHVDQGRRADWRLTKAVLIYNADGKDRAYATLHDVLDRDGPPRLLAGHPATRQACADIARQLGANATLSGFTPAELLYIGAHSIAWWRPAAPARIYFDCTGKAAGDQTEDAKGAALLGKRSGITQQPGLVFVANSNGWYVYAVRDQGRPTPSTKLFRAPYFNVWANGQICTGNVKLPEVISTHTLAEYERAFFGSNFTHPNARGRERIVSTGSAYTFWHEMLSGGKDRPFPLKALNPIKQTLAQQVRKLDSKREDQ